MSDTHDSDTEYEVAMGDATRPADRLASLEKRFDALTSLLQTVVDRDPSGLNLSLLSTPPSSNLSPGSGISSSSSSTCSTWSPLDPPSSSPNFGQNTLSAPAPSPSPSPQLCTPAGSNEIPGLSLQIPPPGFIKPTCGRSTLKHDPARSYILDNPFTWPQFEPLNRWETWATSKKAARNVNELSVLRTCDALVEKVLEEAASGGNPGHYAKFLSQFIRVCADLLCDADLRGWDLALPARGITTARPNKKGCFSCGESGHSSRSCPNKAKAAAAPALVVPKSAEQALNQINGSLNQVPGPAVPSFPMGFWPPFPPQFPGPYQMPPVVASPVPTPPPVI